MRRNTEPYCCVWEEEQARTHLRCVLIPGGLGFTGEGRKQRWGEADIMAVFYTQYVDVLRVFLCSTSVLFAGVDARERFEFFRRRQIFHGVKLEL